MSKKQKKQIVTNVSPTNKEGETVKTPFYKRWKGNKKIGLIVLLCSFATLVSFFIPFFWNPFYFIGVQMLSLFLGDIGTIFFLSFSIIFSLNYFYNIRLFKTHKINYFLMWILITILFSFIIGVTFNNVAIANGDSTSYLYVLNSTVFNYFWINPWSARWDPNNMYNVSILLPRYDQMGLIFTTIQFLTFGFLGSATSIIINIVFAGIIVYGLIIKKLYLVKNVNEEINSQKIEAWKLKRKLAKEKKQLKKENNEQNFLSKIEKTTDIEDQVSKLKLTNNEITKTNSTSTTLEKTNLASVNLNDVRTQEMNFVSNEATISLIDNLNPNNPNDLELLKVFRKIKSKSKNEPSTNLEGEKINFLESLKQKIIEKNSIQKEIIEKQISNSSNEYEEKRKKLLEKGFISPIHGSSNSKIKKQMKEELNHINMMNKYVTNEIDINALDNLNEKTLEHKFEQDLLNLSLSEIDKINSFDKITNDEFSKTVELDLAFATSSAFKDVKEKVNLPQEEIVSFMKQQNNYVVNDKQVLYDSTSDKDLFATSHENEKIMPDDLSKYKDSSPTTLVGNLVEDSRELETPIENEKIISSIDFDKDFEEKKKSKWKNLIGFSKKKIEISAEYNENEIFLNQNTRSKGWCNQYVLPNESIFHNPKQNHLSIENSQKIEANEKVKLIDNLFAKFSISAKVVRYIIGPTITTYEIDVDLGIKLAKITNLEDNLKLILEAKDIRIQAPIPGKNVVGIEVPNTNRKEVNFKELFLKTKNISGNLVVIFGQDVYGQPITFDLTKTPHLLIAGSTGSGKSVAINILLCSLLMKYSPKQLNLILIDPKMVEFASYHKIPHLYGKVISDATKTQTVLENVVELMESRYKLMSKNGVKNISELNEKFRKNKHEEMPFLVVVIDELADLMMVAPKDVEILISRLTQKARAAGIHLVVATQRPSVDVITGLIKANIPSRVAFTVASPIDSRTIIDRIGAEKLVGSGDMLISLYGQIPFRGQGAYIKNDEINALVKHIKSQCSPEYLIDVDEKRSNDQQIEDNIEEY